MEPPNPTVTDTAPGPTGPATGPAAGPPPDQPAVNPAVAPGTAQPVAPAAPPVTQPRPGTGPVKDLTGKDKGPHDKDHGARHGETVKTRLPADKGHPDGQEVRVHVNADGVATYAAGPGATDVISHPDPETQLSGAPEDREDEGEKAEAHREAV